MLQFKTGVVGLGEQSWSNLLPSLAVIPSVEIVALCDTDPSALARAAQKHRAVTFSDYEVMLAELELDAVVVASTPKVHESVLRSTLHRGIATFVEKPPTSSTEELLELIAINKQRTVPTRTQVGLNFGYSEPIRIANELMADREFGRLQYLRITHLNDKPDGPLWFASNHARDFLLSQAIHALAVGFDFGVPLDDTEHISRFDNTSGVFFSVQKMFRNRVDGAPFTMELTTSSTSPYFDWRLELISDNGSMIRINALQEVELFVSGRGVALEANPKWWRSTWKPSPVSSGHRRNGYQHQFEEFFGVATSPLGLSHRIEDCLPIYNVMDRMEAAGEHARIA